MLELIVKLEALGTYDIFVYACTGPEDDPTDIALWTDACRAHRVCEAAQYGEGNLISWLAGCGYRPADMDAIQFEWGYRLLRFRGLLGAASRTYLSHQENRLRHFSLALNHEGLALAATRASETLLDLTTVARWHALSYARIDTHIMTTHADRSFALGVRPSHIAVVPTGLSDEFMVAESEPPPETPGQLCFVGFFGHEPNRRALQWFIDKVWPAVLRDHPTAALLVVGKGSTEVVAETGAPRIEATGEVDSVVPYIRASALCIAPLVNGAGFRGKVNQYAALGKAVVATPIAAADFPYEHGRSIFVAASDAEFAAGTSHLLRDPEYRASMGAAARGIAREHYAWGPIVRQLDRLYRYADVTATDTPARRFAHGHRDC